MLIEVESMTVDRSDYVCHQSGVDGEEDPKAAHVLRLWKAGYLSGSDATSLDGPAMIWSDLAWEGNDLLDTLRSKPV